MIKKRMAHLRFLASHIIRLSNIASVQTHRREHRRRHRIAKHTITSPVATDRDLDHSPEHRDNPGGFAIAGTTNLTISSAAASKRGTPDAVLLQ
jgi:hypothetical protein